MWQRWVFFAIGALAATGWMAHAASAASTDTFQVPAELWDRPRTGQAVMSLPAVRQAISALLSSPEAKLVLRHPAGVEPASQAEELRAWLVAHAVEPARISLHADLPANQPLQIEVRP